MIPQFPVICSCSEPAKSNLLQCHGGTLSTDCTLLICSLLDQNWRTNPLRGVCITLQLLSLFVLNILLPLCIYVMSFSRAQANCVSWTVIRLSEIREPITCICWRTDRSSVYLRLAALQTSRAVNAKVPNISKPVRKFGRAAWITHSHCSDPTSPIGTAGLV